MGLMKDELGGKIMKEVAALRAKTYSYLAVQKQLNLKTKKTIKKKLILMWIIMEKNIKNSLKTNKDLEAKNIMNLLKKLTRLHEVLIMMKEYNGQIRQNTQRKHKDLLCKKEEIEGNNIIKQYMNI